MPTLVRRSSGARQARSSIADPAAASPCVQAAQQRAAQEREERIGAALAQLPQVQAAKRRNDVGPKDARTSTTDAYAREMKMGSHRLQRIPARGLSKVCAVAYLCALAHNLMHIMVQLTPQLMRRGVGAAAMAEPAAWKESEVQ